MIENHVALPEQEQAARQPQQLSAFTLGPWKIKSSDDAFVDHEILRPDGEPLAEIVWLHSYADDANASLIAAAPDMYAALQDCLPLFDLVACGEVQDRVNAALRKARDDQ